MRRTTAWAAAVALVLALAAGAALDAETPASDPATVAPDPPTGPRGDEGLLPGDGGVADWTRAEPARVYSGPELYELIDGGAEAFFEQGFERVTIQQYRRGADEIAIDLYAMRDAAAALGVYLARCGEETPAPGLELRHTAGRHELLAVRGRFYVVIEDSSGRGERAADLVAFARAVAPRLPADERVTALDLLAEDGRVPGSERLIRGPLALQAFIQLGEDDILQLGGRVTALAARYRGPGGSVTRIVAPYPDAGTARRVFANLQANLDPEIQPLVRTADRLVFRDYSGRYGEAVLIGERIELRLGLAERP